jgi:hypothetical protein
VQCDQGRLSWWAELRIIVIERYGIQLATLLSQKIRSKSEKY